MLSYSCKQTCFVKIITKLSLLQRLISIIQKYSLQDVVCKLFNRITPTYKIGERLQRYGY